MTGSIPPSKSSNEPSPNREPIANEGLILQRGGETLTLEKVTDRFTVSMSIPGDRPLTELARQISAQTSNQLNPIGLVEFQVDPRRLEAAMGQVRANPEVAFASHLYRIKNSPATVVSLTDQLTVQFVEHASNADIQAIASRSGLERIKPIAGIPNAFVFRVTSAANANPIKLANRLLQNSAVLAAEPNIAIQSQPFYRPQDSLYPKQWYLQHDGGANLATGAHISIEQAWDITRGIRSIVVAVIDDAFDLNHPDFQGKGKIVAPLDIKGNDFLPLPDDGQENHGTSTAGLAIAEENGIGIVGVAPGCAFMPIRTTGFIDDETIERLFEWAIDHGAAVISCSWGPSAVYFPLSLRQRAVLSRAAREGRNGKGCIIVFAAGNANRPINGAVNEQGWSNNVLRGPTDWLNGYAIHPSVIAVSACTSFNKKAVYSNWGNEISVCAPSNNAPPGIFLPAMGYVPTPPIVRERLQGEGVFTSDRLDAAGYVSGDFVENFGGTSSACPIVAGVAALILSANPDLTAAEVRQILQDTADKITDPDPDPQLSLRRGTYAPSGHSQWFGYGKVNAMRAVQTAQSNRPSLRPVSRWIRQPNAISMSIPDDNPRGVISPIEISEARLIRNIRIYVQIDHSFMGDLEIRLLPPLGDMILLQSRTLGRQSQLDMTYSLETTPLLGRILNQSAKGRWQLQVVDNARMDTGKLKQWQLEIGV
ncbi:MAG: S8 family serine peptidase [Elainellaceae cyanobacterium]